MGIAATFAQSAIAAPFTNFKSLRADLSAQMAKGPQREGAYVVDLSTGHVVFSRNARTPRITASLMKLFTTSTALLRFGGDARLSTRVFATGARQGSSWNGNLYLRGGGDPTFGSKAFVRHATGAGGTVQALAAQIRRSGVRRIRGSVYGDGSVFTDGPGAPFTLVLCPHPLFGPGCPYGPAGRFARPLPNGPMTAISYNRGLANDRSARPQKQPLRFAARALITALRADGVKVTGRAGARLTPPLTTPIATTWSPPMSRLIGLADKPSDNYIANVLLHDIGARVEGQGSMVAGAIGVTDTMRRFGLHPRVATGDGGSDDDNATPHDVVGLLSRMAKLPQGPTFRRALSLAGRNGTLERLAGTPSAGRCQLKDGTRIVSNPRNTVLNLAGYCRSVGGDTFAFAVMMNGVQIRFVPPTTIVSPAYALEDSIVNDLADFRG